MLGKNITKRKKIFAFVCIVIFVGEAILFMLKATTDYKTYTDSEVVKADVINVSGTKNGMLDVKYQYNYGGEKYEENVRQSVDEIKAGDKKEIRIRKSIPEKIITTTMTTAICTIIAFTLCFIASLGVLVAVAWLADLDEEIRERRF